MLTATTVHTTGVNVESLVSIVASITIVIGGAGSLLARNIRHAIDDRCKTAVKEVVAEEITPQFNALHDQIAALEKRTNDHAERVARLEGIETGKRQVVAEAGLTTAPRTSTS